MSSLNYSNMIVTGVVCRNVSAYPVVGSHRLVFELEFDLRKWGKGHAAYVTSLRLVVKLNGVVLGTALPEEEDFLPPVEPEALNTVTVQRRFAITMDHRMLDEIERERKASDLLFEMEVLGTGALCRLQNGTPRETTPVGEFTYAEPLAFGQRVVKAKLYHQVPQSGWVKLLDQMGYARTLLYEIPMPQGEDDGLKEAIAHFESARHSFLSGYYKEAVARLRESLESAQTTIGVGGQRPIWTKAAEDKTRRAMQLQERFLLVWHDTRHLTQLAHHGRDCSREEAHYILGMGALALSLALKSPGVLNGGVQHAGSQP